MGNSQTKMNRLWDTYCYAGMVASFLNMEERCKCIGLCKQAVKYVDLFNEIHCGAKFMPINVDHFCDYLLRRQFSVLMLV